MASTIDSKQFEYVLAYNALTDSGYLSSIIDYCKEKYFETTEVRLLVHYLQDFFQKRNVLPTITELKLYFKTDGEKQAITNLLKIFKTFDKPFNKDELLANTEKFLKDKSVNEAFELIANKFATGPKPEPFEILEVFEKACNVSIVDSMGFDYFNSIDQHCADIAELQETISTGWAWMDEKLGGGFLKNGRALYNITGWTNTGKSIFLGNITTNVLRQNKVVALITLEMPETIYAKRTSADLSKIPFSDLAKYSNDLKAHILSFKKQYPGAKLIIKEFPPKSITVNHLNAFITKLIQKGIQPDLIVVDYLTLLKGNKQYNGMYEEGKAVCEQLRASSYLFKRPILTAAQLNRTGAKTENPGMEKIGESVGVVFTADAQFGIWCNDDERALGIIHMGVQKNRFGQAFGTTTLKIDYQTLSISEFEGSDLLNNTAVAPANENLNKLMEKIN